MQDRAEIERRVDELLRLPTEGGQQIRAIDAYFDSLSEEDRVYAANHGVRRADENLRSVLGRWAG